MEATGRTEPRLSVILVVGPLRDRAQHALDALKRQTIADAVEIIIVDIDAGLSDPLDIAGHPQITYVSRPPDETYGYAKYAGFQQARAPVVAFVEDHCYVEQDWAEALVDAHRGPWAAIGYSFTNANPETYIARAGLVADYGPWLYPVPRGPAVLLPGNNVSYKRSCLLDLGAELEGAMGVDFNLHEALHQRGHTHFIESRARAAHENAERLSSLLQANYEYCRVLGAKRVEMGGWGWIRRVVYGLGAPFGAPLIKFARLVYSLRKRRVLWGESARALPVIMLTYLWSGVGEALGYLRGVGQADQTFTYWEVKAVRSQRPVPKSLA